MSGVVERLAGSGWSSDSAGRKMAAVLASSPSKLQVSRHCRPQRHQRLSLTNPSCITDAEINNRPRPKARFRSYKSWR